MTNKKISALAAAATPLAGPTLTFSQAPPLSSIIEVTY